MGYLVGKPGDGLKCMFHMMNEARIGVGLGAVGVGYAGFEASLDYARNRKQGRPATPAGKDPASPPVNIIEHADVKRMLLAQKAYVEGGLALSLYCGRLVDEARTGAPESIPALKALLEILTPIAKSWPSEWCLEANNLAIQVLGGYGYTRDFPVEQYWRDNRLNMIHEGTHGIQGLDLLGRKVVMDDGKALQLLVARIRQTLQAAAGHAELQHEVAAVERALESLLRATRDAWSTREPDARWPTPRPTCRRSAMSCSPGSGSTWHARPWRHRRRLIRVNALRSCAASGRRRDISSTTNCRRSTAGCRSWRRAIRPVAICRMPGSRADDPGKCGLPLSPHCRQCHAIANLYTVFTKQNSGAVHR